MSTTTPTAQQQLHKAVCDLIASERLEHEVAVALRRWYLENNCFHPEDSAPMDSMFCGIDEWMALNDAIGGQGSDVDQQARADWSAHRFCRALAAAAENSDIALLDMIAAEMPQDWDDADGLHTLLQMATWRPVAKEVQA